MFDLSFPKLCLLGLAAMFVLGPERLPAAAAWLAGVIRQAKDFAAGANDQIRRELGPEFDHLREPLSEVAGPWHELRALRDPGTTLARYLFDQPPGRPAPQPVTPEAPQTWAASTAHIRPSFDLDAT